MTSEERARIDARCEGCSQLGLGAGCCVPAVKSKVCLHTGKFRRFVRVNSKGEDSYQQEMYVDQLLKSIYMVPDEHCPRLFQREQKSKRSLKS